jgi:hypothetical protein
MEPLTTDRTDVRTSPEARSAMNGTPKPFSITVGPWNTNSPALSAEKTACCIMTARLCNAHASPPETTAEEFNRWS